MLFFSYLCKTEFQKGLPSKDHNNDLDLASVLQYFIYYTAETAERAVSDPDGLANFVVNLSLGCVVSILVLHAEYSLGFFVPDRNRNPLEL